MKETHMSQIASRLSFSFADGSFTMSREQLVRAFDKYTLNRGRSEWEKEAIVKGLVGCDCKIGRFNAWDKVDSESCDKCQPHISHLMGMK